MNLGTAACGETLLFIVPSGGTAREEWRGIWRTFRLALRGETSKNPRTRAAAYMAAAFNAALVEAITNSKRGSLPA